MFLFIFLFAKCAISIPYYPTMVAFILVFGTDNGLHAVFFLLVFHLSHFLSFPSLFFPLVISGFWPGGVDLC